MLVRAWGVRWGWWGVRKIGEGGKRVISTMFFAFFASSYIFLDTLFCVGGGRKSSVS